MSKAIAKVPPGLPAGKMENMLVTMRRRARNDKLALDRIVGRFLGIGSAVGGAVAMGAFVGTRMRAGKTTKVGRADIELIVGPLFALVGALIQSKTKKVLPRIFGEVVEGGGIGVLAYYAGSRTEQYYAKPVAPPQQLGLAA